MTQLKLTSQFIDTLNTHQDKLAKIGFFKKGYEGLRQQLWFLNGLKESDFNQMLLANDPDSRFFRINKDVDEQNPKFMNVLKQAQANEYLTRYECKIDRSFEATDESFYSDRLLADSATNALPKLYNTAAIKLGDKAKTNMGSSFEFWQMTPFLQMKGLHLVRPVRQPVFEQEGFKYFPIIAQKNRNAKEESDRIKATGFPFGYAFLPHQINDLLCEKAVNSVFQSNYVYFPNEVAESKKNTQYMTNEVYRSLNEHCQILLTSERDGTGQNGDRFQQMKDELAIEQNPYHNLNIKEEYKIKVLTEGSLFKPQAMWRYAKRKIDGKDVNVIVLDRIINVSKAIQSVLNGEIFTQKTEAQTIELMLHYAEMNAFLFNGDSYWESRKAKRDYLDDNEILAKAERLLESDLKDNKALSTMKFDYIDVSILRTRYGLEESDLNENVRSALTNGISGVKYIF